MDVKVSLSERRALKKLAHQVFARLVVDLEDAKVNNAQDLLFLLALLGVFAVGGASLYLADGAFNLSSGLAGALPAGLSEVSALIYYGGAFAVIAAGAPGGALGFLRFHVLHGRARARLFPQIRTEIRTCAGEPRAYQVLVEI